MRAQELKDYARQHGSDLIGIAAIERFQDEPPERHPSSIFPECRSVIVVGRRILRGSLRGIEEGTNFSSTYGHFGYSMLENNFLSQTTYDVTIWLESRGFEAVPLFGYWPDGMPKGKPVAPGKPAPNVIVDPWVAAQAAGLGEIGLGGFLITPEFGTRQRLALILTDAQLNPDPVRGRAICAECGACAKACPFDAINLARRKKIGLAGHAMEIAEIDYTICEKCPNGAMRAAGVGSRPDRVAAACGRACLVQLEAGGKLASRFENKFRQRTPWALDMLNRPAPAPAHAGN